MKGADFINDSFIEANTDFKVLIKTLEQSFTFENAIVPQRHHHDFPNSEVGKDATLLLMPAWTDGKDAGVKIVTVHPQNGQFNLPAIQGLYCYLDSKTGAIKAIFNAKNLTAKRTAATSALASFYLSRMESSSLLMVGTGALSSNLIRAHASIRPIKEVYIWGRSLQKAKKKCQELRDETFDCIAIEHIEDKVSEVDIISCATLSQTPLIKGKDLIAGQHLDLVGAYKPDMREADDEVIKRATVFVDNIESGLKESGDIFIPLETGVLKQEEIKGDLFKIGTDSFKRPNKASITLFKSVGHALEDLTAARYYYNRFISSNL